VANSATGWEWALGRVGAAELTKAAAFVAAITGAAVTCESGSATSIKVAGGLTREPQINASSSSCVTES
jgi:hypothetical protein